MPKVLIVTNHRKGRSPGQRFRFEKYLGILEKEGYEIIFSNFISESDDKIFYSQGNYWGKAKIFIKNVLLRTKEALTASNYDIIFIYREATMLGTSIFERWMAKSKARLIFDFDDSIWLPNISGGNRGLEFLKRPEKTKEILSVCDFVIAGNKYLKDYASNYSENVEIIPTTIDMSYHVKKESDKSTICIGWTGTETTIPHFLYIKESLEKVYKKYGGKVYFKLIADKHIKVPELNLETTFWKKEIEVEQLSEIDIGIMPLPDNEWTRGKCGFKGLQYMSLAIPTIMSPVGVNSEIIQHGENGFLATTSEEWESCLSQLIEDEVLRKKIGSQAQKTVEEKYSVKANEAKYLNIFLKALTYKK
jgi:glycosyltransferase involved in cell wall biosynthesis